MTRILDHADNLKLFHFQELSEEEIAQRLSNWTPPVKKLKGLLARYRKLVTSAHYGAVLDEN